VPGGEGFKVENGGLGEEIEVGGLGEETEVGGVTTIEGGTVAAGGGLA
jgi:hypothetical protein